MDTIDTMHSYSKVSISQAVNKEEKEENDFPEDSTSPTDTEENSFGGIMGVATPGSPGRKEDVFGVRLVQCIRRFPQLYDPKHHCYSKRGTEDAWRAVAAHMGMEEEMCRMKWRNIRTVFGRYMHKKKGAPKDYFLAEHLKFLAPLISTRERRQRSSFETSSNLSPAMIFINGTVGQGFQKIAPKQSLPEELNTTSIENSEPSAHEEVYSVCDETNQEFLQERANEQAEERCRDGLDSAETPTEHMEGAEQTYIDYFRSERERYEDDADRNFLLSLLPDFRSLTCQNKRLFRIHVMQALHELHEAQDQE